MRIQVTSIDTDDNGFPVDLVQASDLDGPGFATFVAAEFDALSTGELATLLRASE